MSIVKKLIIQGVRSFSPNDNKQQMIDFQTPLTIILGVNGSGKTTIIEALKYAITSKLPPNCNNGSSFVNDPKLTTGFQSMAVVKLEVLDSNGNRVFTTRRIKVTVKDKAGNLTKKELDATMRIINVKGEINEISNKCFDIKTEMCRAMGVSEAILNHVILCHQEDSCWPLEEAKKVKEKFDSIFNTTMYIKCLDQLGKQDKELGQLAKVELEGLKYVVENRKIARKKKQDLETKGIELKSVSDQIAVYEKELKEMETKLRELQNLEREYIAYESKVSEVKGKLEMLERQVNEMKKNIKKEFLGDIPALKEHMEDFEQKHKQKEDKLKSLQRQLREKEEELRRVTTQQKSLLLEEGKFQQEEAANKQRISSVKSHIEEIIATVKRLKETGSQDASFSHSMDSCIDVCEAADPNTLSTDTVVRAMSSVVRAKESEIIKTKAQFEKEENDIQKKIDELRSNKASLDTEINMKKKQMEDHKKSVTEIKNRLRIIDGSNETLALLKDDEQNFMEQIDGIEKSGILDKCKTDIISLEKEIKSLEKENLKLSGTVDLLTEDKAIVDQISSYNRQKIQKQNECKEIMRKIEDDLNMVLGNGNIPENNLGHTLEKKRESIAKELNQKKLEQKQREKELTVNETELKRIQSDLERKERILDDSKDKIDVLLEDRKFDDVYDEVSESLEKTQKDSYYSEAGRYLYKKYIQKLNRNDCCPLCKRGLENKQKVEQLTNEIEQEIEKMQINEPRDKAEIEKLRKNQQELLDLKPLWDEKTKLEIDEIPKLKTKKSSLEDRITNLKELIEDLGAIVATLDSEHSTAVKCGKDVALFENIQKDVKKYEESITKFESSRDSKAKALQGSITLSDAKTQLQGLKASESAKKMEKESKRDMLTNKQNELTKCKEEKNRVITEILRITADLRDREGLESQKKELEESNKQLQDKIIEITKSLPSANAKILEADRSKTECQQRKDECLNGLRKGKEIIERQKTRLNDLAKQIDEFEQKKSRFGDIQKRSFDCKKKIDELERQKNEVRAEIDTVNIDIANHKLEQRNLEDNLACKQKGVEMEKLKVELVEKNKLLASIQNRSVAADRRELSLKHQDLSAKMNKDEGIKKGILGAIHDLKRELNEKHLANAEQEYTTKLVKKTVYEKAQRDVRRYKTVLDQAIMKFHSQKMEMINQILWDYWRKIYKGNDIDCIQIRTENAGPKHVPGTGQKVKVDTGKAARKNYNYRVVMQRRGIELDMRGRCSAGQRVLASIIIRIALAESFSARCGIITLDEPTTNLDQKNINSLADTLSDLAQKMSTRKNFQLIVITHDQEFTERLSSIDSVEKYWKVQRDDFGFSQIKGVPKRG